MPAIPLNGMECEITAHGDGDYFEIHTDDSFPAIAHRVISYVYYVHREPKRFSGGELRLYNTWLQDGAKSYGKPALSFDPLQNGLIVFPSYCYHSVTPIKCDSNEIADQRLTVNGWLSP
jgi:Rps23 Pro-64 3,4-dihydroxylase Tpa1-like proline 4-hydroxylase